MARAHDSGLSEAWEVLDGIREVGTTFVTGNDVYGEVCVANGRVSEETAQILYQEAVRFFTDATIQFSVIIGDENEAADFRFDTRLDAWIITPMSVTGCK